MEMLTNKWFVADLVTLHDSGMQSPGPEISLALTSCSGTCPPFGLLPGRPTARNRALNHLRYPGVIILGPEKRDAYSV